MCHCLRRSTNCYWFPRSVHGKRFHPLILLTSLFLGIQVQVDFHALIGICIDSALDASYHYRASECPFANMLTIACICLSAFSASLRARKQAHRLSSLFQNTPSLQSIPSLFRAPAKLALQFISYRGHFGQANGPMALEIFG